MCYRNCNTCNKSYHSKMHMEKLIYKVLLNSPITGWNIKMKQIKGAKKVSCYSIQLTDVIGC